MDSRKTVHADIRIHVLKTKASAWDAVDSGKKTAEFRKDDRGFTVGDVLVLYRGTKVEDDVIYQRKRISHIVRGPAFGIPEGYAMLSLAGAACEHGDSKPHIVEGPSLGKPQPQLCVGPCERGCGKQKHVGQACGW